MQIPSSSLRLRASFPAFAAIPDLVWTLFLGWTAIGFVVMPFGLGEKEVRHLLGDGALALALLAILRVSDAVWISLAAIVVYLHTAAAEGLRTARTWAAIILLGSLAAEWFGAQTGLPFGPYRYTDHFGWRIGGVVPVTIPLAWMVILLCGRTLILKFQPQASRLGLALGVGCVAVLTDLNLEFVAWKVRGYWIWYPDLVGPKPFWPPWQNFAAWFGLSVLLTFALPVNYELRPHRPQARRPLLVLVLMNTLFVLVYTVRFLRFRG